MSRDNKSVKSFLTNNALIFVLLLMVIGVGFYNERFWGATNIANIAVNTSVRFIIALGVSGCLITRGTDLSAGRLIGLSACICATLLQRADAPDKFFPNLPTFPILGALAIAVLVCSVFGLINGLVISFLQVPPFIATLGMQLIVYGASLVYSKAQPIGSFTSSYSAVATGRITFGSNYIPYLFIYALVIAIYMWVLYNKTRHGKYMYAIGGNENAAEVSGVDVKKTKILIYVLAAILYGTAGFLLASKSGGASVNMGYGYELEAIAACTIGGVSTNGGVGKVSGVLIGVLVFELLKTALQFLGVDPSYQYVVQGVVIIAAVSIDLRKYLAKK
jgi:methyl-galactoside transport system permease protein